MHGREGTPVSAPLLLYDGDCGVCTRTVRFMLARDRDKRTVRFASLQGRVAEEILARHPGLTGVDSMVWVMPEPGSPSAREQARGSMREPSKEQVRVRSGAVIGAGIYLGGPWGVLARVLRLIPRVLRDAAYDAFARVRKRIPGLRRTCFLPTPEESERILD